MSVIEPDFQEQEFPLNCEQCERLGYIFAEGLDEPSLIVCNKCGGETSNVRCPKCEMGGSFVRNIKRHPTAWSCPNCHTKYSLPADFYRRLVPLFGIEELPQAIQERIQRTQEATRPKFSLIGLLALFIWTAIFLVLLLWPFGLGFWLVVKTSNPVWFIMGLAALFAWLRFGRAVIKPVVDWLSSISIKINAM